jgi:diguanylate cyclase (GGDEF)-like protein
MSKVNETTFLLILEKSENDAEKMISLLRNTGIPTRAKRIEDEEDLVEAIDKQAWDLLLIREQVIDFDINQALLHIQKKDRDIPVVVISEQYDSENVAKLIKAGVKDCVSFSEEKHLIMVIRRELESLMDRKKLHRLEVQIRDAEHRCQLLLESSKDAIAYISDGMHIYANASYLQFLGYDDIDDMICIPVLDTLDDASQAKFKELSKPFNEGVKAEPTDASSCRCVREDGTFLDATMTLSAATYDGEACLQIVIRPEHDNAELAEKLKKLSQQDLLTGLYNRQYFMEQLHAVKENAMNEHQHFAVLYISIHNFPTIKTEFGIADADLILRDLAHVINENTRDEHTLARLSDDVFGLISPARNSDEALELAEGYVQAVVDHLFDIGGKTVQVSISIGVTLVTENAPSINDILGRAQIASQEIANDQAQQEGKCVNLFTPKKDSQLDDHDIAISLIEDALENDKFKLLFQPIISLRGQSDEHYEAFVRMLNEEGEEISPYDFLPPSGPTMMANKIDKWVILQTIKHLSEHRSKGHETKLFINLTAETLQDKTFSSWLNVALKAARLPGDSLILQISENSALTYLKQVKDFTKDINTLHCKLSINQFGRALNPFNLLKHIEPDYIKLEGSFTKDMQKDDAAKENAKEIIETLQSMGKITIVPLVESASMLSTLWQAGVNYIQGYYLQAPSTDMNYDFGDES